MKRITVLSERRSTVLFGRREREEFRERYEFRCIETEEQIITIIMRRREKQQWRFSGGPNSLNDNGPINSAAQLSSQTIS